MNTSTRRGLVVLVALLVGAASGALATAALRASPKPVQRIPLAQADSPAGGKGRTLGLSKVLIPAGAAISLHHHPGTQVAYIASGTLTYSVRKGGVTLMSGTPGESPKMVRRIGPGQTGQIPSGDWIVEQPTTIHSAVNRSSKTIVIYLATLFPIGSPAAIAVK
jgi:quercetin dioxygenase-like cupin family protein